METAKSFFYRKATGNTHGVCPLSIFRQEEKQSQSQSPASNINQPILAHSAGQSAGHSVESGRPARPTWWVSGYHSVLLGGIEMENAEANDLDDKRMKM